MKPQTGDTVRVHYTGTLSDGATFDSSEGRDPLEFTVGTGQVIPGFDAAVSALEIGESTTVTIPAEEAYGPHDPEAVRVVPREAFGEDTPAEGMFVELGAPDGSRLPATVSEVRDDQVVLDFNHPLAGQDLTFKLELVEIISAE